MDHRSQQGTDHSRWHNIDRLTDALHAHPSVALAAAIGRPDPHAGELPVAYVQLKPESTATEAELLGFAEKNVGERAAIPKAIHIVDSLPLTAVGKIFKPELIWRETETVLWEVLSELAGVASCQVKVGPDSIHGKAAVLKVTPATGVDQSAIEHAAREVLSSMRSTTICSWKPEIKARSPAVVAQRQWPAAPPPVRAGRHKTRRPARSRPRDTRRWRVYN